MLKEKRYAFPPVKMELAGDFFTILIGFTMEATEAEAYDAQGAALDVTSSKDISGPKPHKCIMDMQTPKPMCSLRHDTVQAGKTAFSRQLHCVHVDAELCGDACHSLTDIVA